MHPSCKSRLTCGHLVLFLLVITFTGPTAQAQNEDNATSDAVVVDDDNLHFVKFSVQLDAETTDSFTVEVHDNWAPLGAARFLELVDTTTFFEQVRFFRVLTDFVAQFGISGDPAVSAEWRTKTLMDDPVLTSNVQGSLTFASGGVNTRTTQIFINLQDNTRLDEMGFAPFAKVVDGMAVVEKLYAGYGEGAPNGNGPDQSRIQEQGNAYLEQDFPLLSYILSAERISQPADLQTTVLPPSDSESQATLPTSTSSESQAPDPTLSELQTSQPSSSGESQATPPDSGALAWKGACGIFSSIVASVIQAAA
jgi:peptidyl-prolyl cis-trans isomerase A (cyclophilin A)